MEGSKGVVLAPKQATAVAAAATGRGANPLLQVQTWVKEQQDGFRTWLSKQPAPVEAAFVTGAGALQGGVLGGLITYLNKDLASSFPNAAQQASTGPALPSFLQPEGLAASPFMQARNFAVMTGANAGISCVLKRIRGVEDIQNSMAAAFGSGVMFSLVSGVGGPNPAANAVSTGLFFALAQGGLSKLGEMMSRGSANNDDVYYARGRSMLTKLGLQKYEKNFKQGLLTDVTLPLMTDRALKDVKIPPGPRLVILDHIQRDPELMKGRR